MKVLITGANGQLGKEFDFVKAEFKHLNFSFADKKALDITDEKAVFEFLGLKCEQSKENSQNFQNESKEASLQKSLNLKTSSNKKDKGFKPNFDAVINCAAYTAVDKAQSEKDKAFAINERGVLNLAKACKQGGTKLVHISTDYVFDGKAYKPLNESDLSSPLGIYGESKLAGEKAIFSLNLKHSCIIRTSWLYSEFGSNFVKTIAHLASEKSELSVVSDQIGSPTNARDLARAICVILPRLDEIRGVEIFHYANEGVASWFDLACEIANLSGAKCKIKPISTDEYKAMNNGKIIAPRHFYSVLDKSKIKAFFGIEIMQWKESLKRLFDTCNARLSK